MSQAFPDCRPVQPLVVTVAEAAKMLSISRAYAYKLIASGELRSIKIGDLRRVPVTAIHEFVERHAAA